VFILFRVSFRDGVATARRSFRVIDAIGAATIARPARRRSGTSLLLAFSPAAGRTKDAWRIANMEHEV
jgi:hypothetical protein